MPGFDVGIRNAGCNPYSSSYVGPPNNVETARNHRYLIEILFPLQPITFFAYKVTRPAPEIDHVVIHNGQDEIQRPAKHRWKPVAITFYEVVYDPSNTNAPAALIYDWWARVMIDIRASIHGRPFNYLTPVVLTMLDGVGNSIWSYHMIDCWPAEVTPSDMAYSDTNISEITLTLRMSKAVEIGRFSSNASGSGFDTSPSTFDDAWESHKAQGGGGFGTGSIGNQG